MSQRARTTTDTRTHHQPVEDDVEDLPAETITITTEMVHEAARRAATYDRDDGISSRDAVSIFLDSVVSEEAMRRYFGASERDESFGYGDDGYDLSVNGAEIDVKSRRWEPPFLLIPADETPAADAYVIVTLDVSAYATLSARIGDEITVRVWGWVPHAQVKSTRIDTTGPRGDVLDRSIPHDEFRAPPTPAEAAEFQFDE